MLEFLSIIRVTPVNSGYPQPKEFEFMADSFSYIPQLTADSSGTFWNCDKTIVIDMPAEDARRYFSIERNCIVHIRVSDRRSFRIGDNEIPARVQISSNLTSANLVIKCKMLRNPLS